MTRKQLASMIATATLAMWPAVSMAQTPPPSTSPPSSTPPATPTAPPRPGSTQQPPTERAGDAMGQKGAATADHAFATAAAEGGLAEVELGKLAADHATNADVKKFAQRMVDDHGKANGELKSLAQAEGVSLPTELDAKHAREVQRLQKMSGAQFDREYMKMMVKDHHKDISAFQHEASRGTDPEVKAFADKTLPTLKEHLSMAEQAEKAVHARSGSGPESANRESSPAQSEQPPTQR
jgi:putative membrane protein